MYKKSTFLAIYSHKFTNKLSLLFVFMLICSYFSTLTAQNSKHPWGIGISGNLLKYKSFSYIPTMGIYANRQLTPTLSFQSFCLFSYKQKFPFRISENDSIGNLSDVSFMLQIRLNNGLFFKEKALLSPYLFLGLGGNYLKTNSDVYAPIGMGIQFRLHQRANLLLNYTQKLSLNRSKQHSMLGLGFVYNLGKPQPFIYADYGKVEIPNEIKATNLQNYPSIAETDAPPYLDNADIEQNKWVFRSALFSDKEKLQVLRQNQGAMLTTFQRKLDSMEAWNYISENDLLADSLHKFKSFFLMEVPQDNLVGELDNLDGVIFYKGKNSKLNGSSEGEQSNNTGDLATLNVENKPKSAKEEENKNKIDTLFLDKNERNLTFSKINEIDTTSVSYFKKLNQMNCYDLKTNILYVGFQDSSELANDNADWQLAEIGNLMQKCKIIKVHLYYGLGEAEPKDEIRDIQRMDFVRLSLMFDYKIAEERIINKQEYAPLSLKSTNEAINKMGKIVIVFE